MPGVHTLSQQDQLAADSIGAKSQDIVVERNFNSSKVKIQSKKHPNSPKSFRQAIQGSLSSKAKNYRCNPRKRGFETMNDNKRSTQDNDVAEKSKSKKQKMIIEYFQHSSINLGSNVIQTSTPNSGRGEVLVKDSNESPIELIGPQEPQETSAKDSKVTDALKTESAFEHPQKSKGKNTLKNSQIVKEPGYWRRRAERDRIRSRSRSPMLN